MSTRVCSLCGDVLPAHEADRSVCLLCLHRTVPQERASQSRRLFGLIDSA